MNIFKTMFETFKPIIIPCVKWLGIILLTVLIIYLIKITLKKIIKRKIK